MKKLLLLFSLIGYSIAFGGCAVSESVAQSEKLPESNISNSRSTNDAAVQNADGGEIINCTPQKIYRGENLKIIFAEKHGGRMAVYREPRRNFYLIDSTETGSAPLLTSSEIEKAATLELNTETTRKTNYAQADASGNYTKIERVFNRSGSYQIVIGREPLDVEFESMPVTGLCRISYVNTKRPPRKSKN